MRFIAKLILIAGSCYVAEQFLPWWSVAICAFVVNFFLPAKGFDAFLSGFLGVGLLWLGFAWLIDADTSGLLTEKVASIFEFDTSFLLVALAGLVGGLVGGFAALSGSLFRNLRHSEDSKGSYYT